MADRVSGTTSKILPVDVNELLVKPVTRDSTAFQVFQTIVTDKQTVSLPTIEEDVEAEFVGELEQYGLDEVTLGEVEVTPRKVGRVVPVSLELASDSDPAFLEIAGQSLTRAISKAVDVYTWGAQAASTKAYAGIRNAATYTFPQAYWNGTSSTSLIHSIIDAQAIAAGSGYNVENVVMHSADFTQLAKDADLQPDPSQPAKRIVAGVPITVCDYISVGNVWAIDSRAAAMVLRSDSVVETDFSAGFLRDQLYLKGRIRVAFGVLDPKGIVEISVGP